MAQQSSPDVDQILSTIRQVESSNNYGATGKGFVGLGRVSVY
jgi:dihydroxyacetone kinase